MPISQLYEAIFKSTNLKVHYWHILHPYLDIITFDSWKMRRLSHNGLHLHFFQIEKYQIFMSNKLKKVPNFLGEGGCQDPSPIFLSRVG